MNLITAAAVYTGDDTTVSGLRTMRLAIAGTGKKPTPIPLFVLPSFAAGDTCAAGAFEPETTLLVNGSIYPMKMGRCMWYLQNQYKLYLQVQQLTKFT